MHLRKLIVGKPSQVLQMCVIRTRKCPDFGRPYPVTGYTRTIASGIGEVRHSVCRTPSGPERRKMRREKPVSRTFGGRINNGGERRLTAYSTPIFTDMIIVKILPQKSKFLMTIIVVSIRGYLFASPKD